MRRFGHILVEYVIGLILVYLSFFNLIIIFAFVLPYALELKYNSVMLAFLRSELMGDRYFYVLRIGYFITPFVGLFGFWFTDRFILRKPRINTVKKLVYGMIFGVLVGYPIVRYVCYSDTVLESFNGITFFIPEAIFTAITLLGYSIKSNSIKSPLNRRQSRN